MPAIYLKKRGRMLKRLQRKFVLLATAISIVTMLIIGVAINAVNYNNIINNSDAILDLLIENDMEFAPSLVVLERFSRELAFTTRYFVVGNDEDLGVSFVNTNNISSVSPEYAIIYAEQAKEQGREYGTIDNFRYVRTQYNRAETFLFLDIEEQMMSFTSFMNMTIFIFVTAVVVIFVLSCIFSRFAVAPIAKSYERQKRFITDVSHEFKTPLSIINADCEVLEIEGDGSEWTQSIKNQIVRLNSLVDRLITLSKLDEQSARSNRVDVPLSLLLFETLDEFVSSAQQKKLAFVTNIPYNIIGRGDANSLRTLFETVVENAIKYADCDSPITVQLDVSGGKKVISVENYAREVFAGRHDDWFTRFYREDISRNGDGKSFGIGLSAAKAICDNHGGKIIAESKSDGMVKISIFLP